MNKLIYLLVFLLIAIGSLLFFTRDIDIFLAVLGVLSSALFGGLVVEIIQNRERKREGNFLVQQLAEIYSKDIPVFFDTVESSCGASAGSNYNEAVFKIAKITPFNIFYNNINHLLTADSKSDIIAVLSNELKIEACLKSVNPSAHGQNISEHIKDILSSCDKLLSKKRNLS